MEENSTQNRKQLIIVGGSFSGFNLARDVWQDLNIIIIDKKDYVDFVPGITRMLA